MDKIRIKDLLVRCILGIKDEERAKRQDVLINVTLHTDTREPGRSDRFEDAVDYRALNKRILRFAEDSKFYLVEALAEGVADLCLQHPGVQRVDVQVEKPGALRFARSVGVEITREQPDRTGHLAAPEKPGRTGHLAAPEKPGRTGHLAAPGSGDPGPTGRRQGPGDDA